MAGGAVLVDLVGVGASRPGRPLFEDLSLTVHGGDRIGIVGINGGGKSTLLRLIAGVDEPEVGTVRFGRGVRIAHLDQRPVLRGGSVRAAAGGTWESEAVLDRLGMGAMLDARIGELSGGQAKRVALAAALVTPADLLVLDEPTNHLDLDATMWLEERLASERGGLVIVSHDRHLLDRVTSRMLELDRGHAYTHDGGYASYLDAKVERAGHAASAERVRRNLARRELAWLRRGAPARTSKPKARIATATAVVEQRPEAEARDGELNLHVDTPRLGDVVIELHDVSVFRGTKQVLDGVDLDLDPRERLGVVGPNGAGKSTLLDVIAGRLEPASGERVVGSTARLAYFDQLGSTLDPELRARDAVVGPHRTPDHRDKALMESFWFDDDAQWAPVGTLSGGERRRLQLLMTLAGRPNVLLLDEPTNDLDIDTLRALEEFLDDWPGALVVVSHDRALLERTVTDVVLLDGSGKVVRRPGGFAAYEAERLGATRRRGSVATPPSEIRPQPAPRERGAGTEAGVRSKGRSPKHLRNLLRSVAARSEDLEVERSALLRVLGDPASGHAARDVAGRRLGEVEVAAAAAEEDWLELAAEAEARGLDL